MMIFDVTVEFNRDLHSLLKQKKQNLHFSIKLLKRKITYLFDYFIPRLDHVELLKQNNFFIK